MITPLSWLTEDQVLRLQKRTLTPSIVLTVVLAARVFLAPITPDGHTWVHPVNQALFAAALVYMAATTRRHLLIAGTLAVCGVTLELLQLFTLHLRSYEWLQFAVFVTLLIYAFWLMIKDLFTAKKVDATILLLAVNCYLLIGILWVFFYLLVEHANPGSFALAGDLGMPVWKHLYYFSFVTLTTLGYGDIQPVTAIARSLAMVEAVCGVLFTGILVARLIGIYSAKQD